MGVAATWLEMHLYVAYRNGRHFRRRGHTHNPYLTLVHDPDLSMQMVADIVGMFVRGWADQDVDLALEAS